MKLGYKSFESTEGHWCLLSSNALIFKFQTPSQIFPPNTGGAAKMAQEKSVRLLGRLPLDPRVARCCDEGLNALAEFPDSPVVSAMAGIVKGGSLGQRGSAAAPASLRPVSVKLLFLVCRIDREPAERRTQHGYLVTRSRILLTLCDVSKRAC